MKAKKNLLRSTPTKMVKYVHYLIKEHETIGILLCVALYLKNAVNVYMYTTATLTEVKWPQTLASPIIIYRWVSMECA